MSERIELAACPNPRCPGGEIENGRAIVATKPGGEVIHEVWCTGCWMQTNSVEDWNALPRPSPSDGEELALARECFLNMLADARKWDVDYDGDTDAAGRYVSYVTHFIEVDSFAFDQLPEALGIEPAYMETMEGAIMRALNEPHDRDACARDALSSTEER